MSPDAFTTWLATLLLLAVRLGVAIGLSPAWSAYGVPGTVRVVLVLALATLAAGAGPTVSPALELEAPARLFEALAAELCIGALLGLGLRVALAAFALAGRLLDVQVGFAIGSLFDPVAQAGAARARPSANRAPAPASGRSGSPQSGQAPSGKAPVELSLIHI